MASVPDTNNFTLQDVTAVVLTTEPSTLIHCYDESNVNYFDPTYNLDPSSLYNFRNYGAIIYKFQTTNDTTSSSGGSDSGILCVSTNIIETGNITPDGSITFMSRLKIKATDQDTVTPCNPVIMVDINYCILHNTSKEIIYKCTNKNISLTSGTWESVIDGSENIINLSNSPNPFKIDCSIFLEFSAGSGCLGDTFDLIVDISTKMYHPHGNVDLKNPTLFTGTTYWNNAART